MFDLVLALILVALGAAFVVATLWAAPANRNLNAHQTKAQVNDMGHNPRARMPRTHRRITSLVSDLFSRIDVLQGLLYRERHTIDTLRTRLEMRGHSIAGWKESYEALMCELRDSHMRECEAKDEASTLRHTLNRKQGALDGLRRAIRGYRERTEVAEQAAWERGVEVDALTHEVERLRQELEMRSMEDDLAQATTWKEVLEEQEDERLRAAGRWSSTGMRRNRMDRRSHGWKVHRRTQYRVR